MYIENTVPGRQRLYTQPRKNEEVVYMKNTHKIVYTTDVKYKEKRCRKPEQRAKIAKHRGLSHHQYRCSWWIPWDSECERRGALEGKGKGTSGRGSGKDERVLERIRRRREGSTRIPQEGGARV